MVRKTKEAALATRESLLDAAEGVFCREGVARTSLAEIATQAGVSRGAIYWHFRDKAELLAAMCERTALPLEAALARAAAAAAHDPLTALRNLAVEALQRLAQDPHARAVFEILSRQCELATTAAHAQSALSCRRQERLCQIESLFVLAVGAGQLAADTDTRLAAYMMHAYIAGLMHEWVQGESAHAAVAAVPAMIDAFFAGLTACPPRRITASAEPAAASMGDADAWS